MSAYQLSEEAGNVIPLGYSKSHVAAKIGETQEAVVDLLTSGVLRPVHFRSGEVRIAPHSLTSIVADPTANVIHLFAWGDEPTPA